jgi:predicted MFS family arabinose efflux permease
MTLGVHISYKGVEQLSSILGVCSLVVTMPLPALAENLHLKNALVKLSMMFASQGVLVARLHLGFLKTPSG